MLDERQPQWRGVGYHKTGVEGWVGVEGLPGGANDVSSPLGKVG